MRKTHVRVQVTVGKALLYVAKLFVAGPNTLVESTIPERRVDQMDTAAVLLLASLDMIEAAGNRRKIREVLAELGHEMEDDAEMLTREQFRQRLLGNTPSVPDDIPF